MKFLTIILSIYSISLFSQNTLYVGFNLCNKKDNYINFGNEYRIIFNDSIVKKFEKETTHYLEDGKYRVEYKTYFGWKSTLSFLLNDNITYYFDFCLDELNPEPIDIYNIGIDSIDDGEELTIIHNYSGCFNHGGDKILVRRKKNKFYVIFKDIERKLKNKELDYFKNYEIELINLNNEFSKTMCTAFFQNIIEYRNIRFEYSESCPKWFGFEELKKKLKLK
jgi:hypothetical protein